MLNVILALVDFTASNGATRVLDRSHLEPPSAVPRDPLATVVGERFVLCPAGSAICFGGGLWHSGTRNASTAPRHAIRSVAAVAAQSSRMRMWEAAMACVPDQRWLTAPRRVERAANKATQYFYAVHAGLAVPPTVIGNDRDAALQRLGGPVLMKYLGDAALLWNASAEGHAAVSVEVDLDAVSAESARSAPAIFQQLITTHRELRVVAIRDAQEVRVFAASDGRPGDDALPAHASCRPAFWTRSRACLSSLKSASPPPICSSTTRASTGSST